MTYAISDIHGEYDKYKAMLEQIQFSSEDTLYILGDVVDRGPEPAEILKDMAARENVFPILGNHEAMAIEMLEALLIEITEENCETRLNMDLMSRVMDWQMNGGVSTMRAFQSLNVEERADLLDYMRDFPLYETVDVGDRTFVLVHAALGNFNEKRPLGSYRAEELVLGRLDFHSVYYTDPNIFIVTGHTPTLAVTGKAEIYREGSNFCIDCGACSPGGRLACLCLDTMQEFYV